MPETQLNVRYDTDIIGDFIKESNPANDNLYLTELLEAAEKKLIDFLHDDEKFVERFNKIVESNKDLAMLLAVHVIADYDGMGEMSKERVRAAIFDAVRGSQNDLLESKLKLLQAVSGRLAASNLEDKDMKLFDLVSNLFELRSVDLPETSSILSEIDNDILKVTQNRRTKKETL